MTAAEAHATAAAEGLTLVRAENEMGFKGVSRNNRSAKKPFQAQLRHEGRNKNLGMFATAEEAALAVARFIGPAGAAAPPRRGRPRKRPAASGAGPSAPPSKRGKQPAADDDEVYVFHNGRSEHLGSFATAEEAALNVARFLGPPGAAPPTGRKRPAASGAGPSEPPSKRDKQPADDDDDEEYVVKAEAVSDDDDAPTPPPAPPVLCYCERPAALLDGRWVCAQLVEGDFCILGREDE